MPHQESSRPRWVGGLDVLAAFTFLIALIGMLLMSEFGADFRSRHEANHLASALVSASSTDRQRLESDGGRLRLAGGDVIDPNNYPNNHPNRAGSDEVDRSRSAPDLHWPWVVASLLVVTLASSALAVALHMLADPAAPRPPAAPPQPSSTSPSTSRAQIEQSDSVTSSSSET